MSSDFITVESRLWATADPLWANTGLKPAEFSTPVLGLIFLRSADSRFAEGEALLVSKGLFERKNTNLRTTRDSLLPRLISGELDVSDLRLPEEAAA